MQTHENNSKEQPGALASTGGESKTVQVAIAGTGFAGLGMAIRMKQEGFHDFVVLERASEIGGT